MAYAKGKKDVEEAKTKFTLDSTWTFTNIQFEPNGDSSYISSALKLTVDLKKSIHKKFDDGTGSLAKFIVPPRTVAEVTKITSTKAIDLLAIVVEVSEIRPTKRGDVLDVTLMDASTDDQNNYAKVSISIWGSEKFKHIAVGQPTVFLNLLCKVDGANKQINHWEDSLLQDPPECKKKEQLLQMFDQLRGASNTVTLTTPFAPTSVPMDVSGPQPLGVAAFMDFTSRNPEAKVPEVMQLLHCNLVEPEGAVTHEGGDRIWFVTKLHDVSGTTEVGVPERVALELASLDRDAFKQAASSGDIQFPLLCNVRVSRSLKDAPSTAGASQLSAFQGSASSFSASQPRASVQYVNHTIQDIWPADWNAEVSPNAAYESVISLLNHLPRHDEGIVFCFLSDVVAHPHDGFNAAFPNGNIVKGTAAVVLISSAHKSNKPVSIGQGFQIKTENVKDAANPNGNDAQTSYRVTGYCTLDNVSKFVMDPLRGQGPRSAIVFISRCEESKKENSEARLKSF